MQNISEAILQLGFQCSTDFAENAKSIKSIVVNSRKEDYKKRCKLIALACRLNGKSVKEYAAVFTKAAKAETEKEALKIINDFIA